MDDLTPYTQWVQTAAFKTMHWLSDNFGTSGAAIQMLVIVLLVMAAWALATRSARWADAKLLLNVPTSTIRVHASYRELFFLAYAIIFLWAATLVAGAAEMPTTILRMLASLVTAWGIIRLTSSTISSPLWAGLVAFVLWLLAALDIAGWLDTVTQVLSKAVLTFGEFQLSLLTIMKVMAAFALLLWVVGFISRALQRSFYKATSLTPSQRVLFYKLSNITLYVGAILIGLNVAGLDLTALTVFSGALGLGIGFGLQKVFSNLISGFILLLDKSVKPGDVIVVGNTFGWVNSLGARYVSVLTRDGKEHLIPNENLITQEVENWSYSNQKVRIHIPIGVAYGSDIHKVKELILSVVKEHPRILKAPNPVCLITGFGDNSIDHEIRAWITDPQEGVSNVKSDIYYKLWDVFHAHGIGIPFPQRDVHLKLDDALKDLLVTTVEAKK